MSGLLNSLYEVWVPSNQHELAEAESRMFDRQFVPVQLQSFTVITTEGYHIHTVTTSQSLAYRQERIGSVADAAHTQEEEEEHVRHASAQSAPPTQTAADQLPPMRRHTLVGDVVESQLHTRHDAKGARSTQTDESKKGVTPTTDSHSKDKKPVLLLVHGFGGGCGLWSKNMTELASQFDVFAIDVPGFARSCVHPEVDTEVTAEQAQAWFVTGIEGWRKSMGFEKMHILGHSMGGYISGSYALKYPERVERLYLVSAFGIKKRSTAPLTLKKDAGDMEKKESVQQQEEEEEEEDTKQAASEDVNKRLANMPWWVRAAAWGAQKVGPMTLARGLGPLGKMFLARRGARYDDPRYDYGDDRVTRYIYHCVMQCRSGEKYFWALNEGFGYAQRPLIDKLSQLRLPLVMIYGQRDFITPDSGLEVERRLRQAGHRDISVHLVPKAAHHCYASHAECFNRIVLDSGDERKKTRVVA